MWVGVIPENTVPISAEYSVPEAWALLGEAGSLREDPKTTTVTSVTAKVARNALMCNPRERVPAASGRSATDDRSGFAVVRRNSKVRRFTVRNADKQALRMFF